MFKRFYKIFEEYKKYFKTFHFDVLDEFQKDKDKIRKDIFDKNYNPNSVIYNISYDLLYLELLKKYEDDEFFEILERVLQLNKTRKVNVNEQRIIIDFLENNLKKVIDENVNEFKVIIYNLKNIPSYIRSNVDNDFNRLYKKLDGIIQNHVRIIEDYNKNPRNWWSVNKDNIIIPVIISVAINLIIIIITKFLL